IDFSDNLISSLPDRLPELKRLKVLYINNDAYFNLEQNIRLIAQIKSLKELHVENDGLTQVPANIGELKQIEYLFMVGNKIKALPPEIGQMKHLRFLDLSENPLPPLLYDERVLDPKVIIRLSKGN
ncbi:MAG: leucine-rich repeat domain-containing protein, partial [Cyclobacteriaceae bacterium]